MRQKYSVVVHLVKKTRQSCVLLVNGKKFSFSLQQNVSIEREAEEEKILPSLYFHIGQINSMAGDKVIFPNQVDGHFFKASLSYFYSITNRLARIVADTTKYSHITPVKKESSLIAYQALLCFQDDVQIST